jgi:hypothetical protein
MITKTQRRVLRAATYHPDGLVYVGTIHPATLAALIRQGLMEQVSTFKGQPSVARINDAGRTKAGAL